MTWAVKASAPSSFSGGSRAHSALKARSRPPLSGKQTAAEPWGSEEAGEKQLWLLNQLSSGLVSTGPGQRTPRLTLWALAGLQYWP